MEGGLLAMSQRDRVALVMMSRVEEKAMTIREAAAVLGTSYRQGRRIYRRYVIEGGISTFTTRAKGGCLIATATYGTPMAEEVQILREFRDGYLLTNPVGQAFVDFYYEASPPIAEFLDQHPALKPIARVGLVPVVAITSLVVNTTAAAKTGMVGLLVLLSVTLVVWARRRGGRAMEYA